MTVFVKRETLHQIIDNLTEHQLLELAKFVERLLAKEQRSGSSFDLWRLEEYRRGIAADDTLYDLNEVIQAIKNTPPNEQAIMPPTKNWAEYAAETPQETNISLDVATWNQTWDTLEAEMEANSLAHEEFEGRENQA